MEETTHSSGTNQTTQITWHLNF